MPVYEYVCMRCEDRFDRLLPVAQPAPECPRCGSDRVRRRLSVFATGGGGDDATPSGCACGGACACGR